MHHRLSRKLFCHSVKTSLSEHLQDLICPTVVTDGGVPGSAFWQAANRPCDADDTPVITITLAIVATAVSQYNNRASALRMTDNIHIQVINIFNMQAG